jgi:hypothetical protein
MFAERFEVEVAVPGHEAKATAAACIDGRQTGVQSG